MGWRKTGHGREGRFGEFIVSGTRYEDHDGMEAWCIQSRPEKDGTPRHQWWTDEVKFWDVRLTDEGPQPDKEMSVHSAERSAILKAIYQWTSEGVEPASDDMPTIEQWTQWMHDAPPDQALTLLDIAQARLAQNVQNQRWGVLIGIAHNVLRDRGIPF
jgi:hypothetical protein